MSYNKDMFWDYIKKGNFEGISFCIENGVDVNIRNNDGISAIIGSAYLGQFEITKFLSEKGAKVSSDEIEMIINDNDISSSNELIAILKKSL